MLSPEKGGREAESRLRTAVALLLGIALGVLGLMVIARQAAPSFWSGWAGRLLGRSTQIDVSQPTVVNKIQQLQRLETVVYTMDKVVSGEKENVILPNFLAGDRLLMVVHGEVVAGVDFSGLKGGDVAVEEKKVVLRLPQRGCFRRALIMREPRCIRGRRVCWSRWIRTWRRKCARRQRASFSRRRCWMEF